MPVPLGRHRQGQARCGEAGGLGTVQELEIIWSMARAGRRGTRDDLHELPLAIDKNRHMPRIRITPGVIVGRNQLVCCDPGVERLEPQFHNRLPFGRMVHVDIFAPPRFNIPVSEHCRHLLCRRRLPTWAVHMLYRQRLGTGNGRGE